MAHVNFLLNIYYGLNINVTHIYSLFKNKRGL